MGKKSIKLVNLHLKDLNPILVGEDACAPGHSFGPFVREFTLIHFVRKGHGLFYARGKCWPVKAGEAFLIIPGEVTTYCADSDDPWEYQWIGFDGELAEHFSRLPPVFPISPHVVNQLLPFDKCKIGPDYRLVAGLFCLYDELLAPKAQTRDYVRQAQNVIETAYAFPLTVESISAQLGLTRNYLSRQFRQETGVTIQQWIIQVRIREGQRYLKLGYSVQEAARMCGYNDPANFSKMFKQQTGVSPAHWKKAES